jgi:DNA-binding HxlR family transcriptional regulator
VAADVVGGKWKTIVLFYLMDGTMRFNQLRREIPGVTVPPHVDYKLTPLGRTLEPVIREMAAWGKRYRKRFEAA